jgi:hypothetical protein
MSAHEVHNSDRHAPPCCSQRRPGSWCVSRINNVAPCWVMPVSTPIDIGLSPNALFRIFAPRTEDLLMSSCQRTIHRQTPGESSRRGNLAICSTNRSMKQVRTTTLFGSLLALAVPHSPSSARRFLYSLCFSFLVGRCILNQRFRHGCCCF